MAGIPGVINLGNVTVDTVSFRLDGAAEGDSSGYSVASAGDVNGDGFDDVIIGDYTADPNGSASGSSYVVFGGATNPGTLNLGDLTAAQGFRLDGAAEGDVSGYSVASAGDVNGDGFDDLVIGTPEAAPGGRSFAGSTYVVFGGATGPGNVNLGALTAAQGFRIDGAGAFDGSGFAVASAGDVNGDRYGDVIVGAYTAGPNGPGSGSSYVVFGGATPSATLNLGSLTPAQGFRLDGAAVDDHSGFSVASAGDVNGDGYDDLIIGGPGADANGGNSGRTYVVFGGAAGTGTIDLGTLTAAQGFRLDGAAAGDAGGISVASAGDVNGDGYDDLIIGASSADPNGFTSGSSYVVLGGTTNPGSLNLGSLTAAQGFRLDGAAPGDNSGRSVASAGDVNGDGFDDVIIGAYTADPNGFSSGSSYVVFGGATNPGNLNLGSLTAAQGFRLDGAVEGDLSGISVASAGDVNGDGYADLIVGAYGADPNDVLSGSSYVVLGEATAAVVRSTAPGGGALFGGDFGDALTGLGGDDRLVGRLGDDRLVGNAGDDGLWGGAGADTLTGGEGSDTASYADAASGVSVRLDSGRGTAGDAAGDRLSGIENLAGSAFDDVLVGDGGANLLEGGAGEDVLLGRAGVDTVSYAGSAAGVEVSLRTGIGRLGDAEGDVLEGIENLVGSRLDDGLTGGAGANVLRGGDGADRLAGLSGADVLDGGAGYDLVDYRASRAGVTVDLGTGLGAGGDAAGDTLAGVERVVGSRHDDALRGGAGAERHDGGNGADRLEGGGGADLLGGGAGADTFVWALVADSVRGAADRVTDFDGAAGDRLDLSAFGATYVGTGAFLRGGEASVGWAANGRGDVVVRLDADGDGTVDLQVGLLGVTSLAASDFLL